jgi:hypothetical protein
MSAVLELQSPVAFHLTGKRAGSDLAPVIERGLRPAALAQYRDLTELRYGFPVVLQRPESDRACVASLSELVDRALEADKGPEPGKLRGQAHRLEREIRRLLADGSAGTLRELLDQAAARVAGAEESVARLRKQLKTEGKVIECDAQTPSRVVAHAWEAAQKERIDAFRADLEGLVLKLADILRADDARSLAARTPQNLKSGFASTHADVFDFEGMSRLLANGTPAGGLSAARRARIERTLAELRSQRLYAAHDDAQPYAFRFASCAAALAAFRERTPALARLSRAITIARLEIDGAYSEPRHDPLFEQLGERALDARDLAAFPDYLVCLNTGTMTASEQAELMEILAGGLPVKVLVQTDDILAPPPFASGHLGFGARARQVASMALGLHDVFVLQSSASSLPRCAERIDRAMRYRGPALFSVFSGASAHAPGLPAYLNAAAAMESRAFPAFAYDPSAGGDWAARFTIEINPQPDKDWPVHRLEYEDAAHQRVLEERAFTLIDYLACDRRFSEHFAQVPQTAWNESLVPASECLDAATGGIPGRLPTLAMVDASARLQKVIVDERLLREARRCRDLWRNLQEFAGIHNSYVARALAEAQAQAKPEAKAEAQPAPTPPAPAAAEAQAAVKPSSDEPYIETPRCSTCNECIQINSRMFAYDDNKQARIVDASAGTYRQLVEAAESCQVAIIHPGKPKDPNEPGLEELLKRAEAFN